MERYTKEFKQQIEDSKFALAISMPLVITEEALIKIENTKGAMKVETEGGAITQLIMLATATAQLIKTLEAKKETGEEDVDMMAMFLSAMEIADEVGERLDIEE